MCQFRVQKEFNTTTEVRGSDNVKTMLKVSDDHLKMRGPQSRGSLITATDMQRSAWFDCCSGRLTCIVG